MIPVLIREAIDNGVHTERYGVAIHYALLKLLVGILSGIFSFIGRYLLIKSSQYAVYNLRMDAFSAIWRQEMEFL